MKKAILQFGLIAIGVVFCGYLSSSEFDTIKEDDKFTNELIQQYTTNAQREGSIIDLDNNGVHDNSCMCGYCVEEDCDYIIRLGVMDSTNGNYAIYLMDGLDTIADLSNNKQLRTIIDEDNL